MTDPSTTSAALADYHATFGNSYNPRRLWRDRRAILAQPRIATETRPPLSLSPLRFALTLAVVPMLAIGWATAQLASVLYPDGRAPSAVETNARAIEQPLIVFLADADADQIHAWSKIKRDVLPPDAARLYDQGKQSLGPTSAAADPTLVTQAISGFVSELQRSTLAPEQQRVVAAKLLRRVQARRHADAVLNAFMHSILEGGAAMQVIAAFTILLSAWTFRRLVRRDPRFPLGERADRLYLYYSTSRLFWLTMASIGSYGVISFASASGDAALLEQANTVSQWLALAALLYLLLFSRSLVRALRDDDALPRGSTWSIAWRLIAAQVLAMLALIVVAFVLGILLSIAAMMWFNLR